MKNIMKLLALSCSLISGTAQPAAEWGAGKPANEVWFHPNDRAFYPLANFYEVDGNRDARRYPAAGKDNKTAFAGLHIGFAGQPCMTWRSTEHFFQTIKFLEQPDFQNLCRNSAAQTPGDVFRLARQRNADVVAGWHNMKLYVMYAAVKAKFAHNEELQKLLLDTSGDWIVEHVEQNANQAQGDNYWGDTNGGHNYLGKILILVRHELAEEGFLNAWGDARLKEMGQLEADILRHQQAWQNAGHPLFVDQHNQQLTVRSKLAIVDGAEEDECDEATGSGTGDKKDKSYKQKKKTAKSAESKPDTAQWIKDQWTNHPVRTTALTTAGVGTCALVGDAIVRKRKSFLGRLVYHDTPARLTVNEQTTDHHG